VWQLFRGQTFDWFKAWRLSAQRGPVDIFPPITPKMRREAQVFTVALLTLACMAGLLSLLLTSVR